MSSDQSLHSMTGYASTDGQGFDRDFRLIAKTLNHRFLEAKIRLPRELQFLDSFVRSELKKRLRRGVVEFSFEFLPRKNRLEADYEINQNSILKYSKELQKIRNEDPNLPEPTLSDFLTFPDVVTKKINTPYSDYRSDPKKSFLQLKPALDQLLDQLICIRNAEGESLNNFFNSKMSNLKQLVKNISEKRKDQTKIHTKRISKRVREIYEKYAAPSELNDLDQRIATELALLLDRTDIEEELSRLDHHISLFNSTLSQKGAVGKKLEFVLQEMHREVNTIGSKAQDFGMSEDVVQAKVTIEQIREQVLNTE